MINKIFTLFFGILLISSFQGWSRDYYLSNSGSDNNNGFTEQTAWKTLSKLNKEMNGFKAGDNIYFHKGSTFYGTLKIHYLNGSSSARISFKSYGTGNNPIITNGKIVDNWTKFSGNIYEAKVPETVYQVFKNDKSLMNGRTDLSNHNSITKIGSQSVLFSEDLSGMNKLEGATIVLKVRSWYMSNRTITKFDSGSGRVEINKAPNYDMREGNEFFINNHINLLDKQDEWSYNKSEQKLYIYSSSTPKGIISAVSDNNGIEIFNCSYIQVSDIQINFVNNAGIYINKSSNIDVEKNTINYAYRSGIMTENGRNIIIKNNSINNSVVHGIYNYTDYSILESNYISNTGIVKNMTYKQSGQSYGIKLKGSNNIVRNNNITDTGYIGIRFYHENGIIENNLIENFCMELSDGGGIYTFNTNFGDKGASGTLVKNNIILGSTNANKHNIVVGLYADDRAHDVVFQGNSIANVDRGVFLHNTKKIEVINNNIYRATDTGIGLGEDFQNGEMVNNVITGNSVFMEETELYKYALKIKSKWNNYKMGIFDNNKYFNPYSIKNIGLRNISDYWLNSGNPKSLNLKEWQNKSKEDLKSEENNFYWDDHVLENVIGDNLLVNGDFEKNVSDWGSPGTDLSMKEESNEKFLNAHPTEKGGASLSNTFQVKSNTEYLFEFDIKSDSDVTLRLDVARTGAPYNGFMVRPIWVTKNWKHYSIKINSDISASDMRINFYSLDGLTDYQLDNVVFQEVRASPPLNKSFFAYNAELKPMNVAIPAGVWEDLQGETYSGSILLAPFSSKTLIVSDKTITEIEANGGPNIMICNGESTTLTASGGSSYEWSNGATTQSITVTPGSTTTYSVTVLENGESDTDEVIVTVNEVIANAGADQTISEGESITLTATGGDSYLWSTGATTETITVGPNTNITYTVIATKGSCDDTDDVKITVSPSAGESNPVTANAGADQSICKGDNVTLTASGGSGYNWNTGATTKSITVSPSNTSTYTVTVNEGSESDTDDVIVSVNSVTANAGSDRTITEGETITLVATGGETYLWNTGENTNSISVSPSSTKVYSVVTYKGTCQDTDEVRVSVEPIVGSGLAPAQADGGEDMTICLGETIVLNGAGGETYAWSTGETTSSISISPNRTSTFELFATRGGVTNSDSVTITVKNCSGEAISDEEDLAILELSVYPNPTSGDVSIRIDNLERETSFIINDAKGSTLHHEVFLGQNTVLERDIDLSRYTSGLYFVRLYNDEQNLIKKIIVQ